MFFLMKTLTILILLLVGFLWLARGSVVNQQKPVDSDVESASDVKTREQATLLKVIDGDTITVSVNGNNEVVRIIGIDTPEVDDATKKVECLGKEATEVAKSILNDNKSVFLEADPTQRNRDKYQRLLRYVWIGDGKTDFGKFMIEAGYASEYTYNLAYKYQSEYKESEKEARGAKKGLWATVGDAVGDRCWGRS